MRMKKNKQVDFIGLTFSLSLKFVISFTECGSVGNAYAYNYE